MRLRQTVWRAHHPRWSFAPDSGAGAAFHGGRFNRIGTPALYTSLRFETAWLEAQQGFPFKAQPMTICGYEVDCEDIVDLTDPEGRASLGIKLADLKCGWAGMVDRGLVPPSWSVASRLMETGCAGILVNSFASGATEDDVNVVFWHWAPEPPHQVRVIDPGGRLPQNDLSWRWTVQTRSPPAINSAAVPAAPAPPPWPGCRTP
jgi:RES domain-containing protein